MINLNKKKICIVGLGYVGLPLLLAFAKKNKVIGYDIDRQRVESLLKGIDINKEVKAISLKEKNIFFTNNINDISQSNIIIVTIPTPIYKNNKPNLEPLKNSIKSISSIIKKNTLLIIESTVYPGVTENIISKIIQKNSKLKLNKDFFLGYSPERINPGEKKRKIEDIKKVVSGSNEKVTNIIYKLYSEIISAGVFKAKNIKTAEASKVIENVQRDLNIALINDLSMMFKRDDIDIFDVLDASSTKWNFHPYTPGLVGGHCIGVDPYYLTYWSKQKGHNSDFILSGRKINESMNNYLIKNIIKIFKEKNLSIIKSEILIFGVTFKENCADIRNSKALVIAKYFIKKAKNVSIYDPLVNENTLNKELDNYKLINLPTKKKFDCLIILTPHDEIKKIGHKNMLKFAKNNFILIDIKKSLGDVRVDFSL